MKRSILVATLMVTVAGVASANLLTTRPDVSASPQAQAATSPAPVAVPAVATAAPQATKVVQLETPPAPAASAKHVPTVQKASVDAKQAPVPLLVKPRPPVNLPAVEEKAVDAKVGDANATAGDQAAAGDTAGESAAKAAVEADGYKGVKILRKGVNGVWHASGLRGSTTVMLTVDASGSVSAD
jgi:hypothetical protein